MSYTEGSDFTSYVTSPAISSFKAYEDFGIALRSLEGSARTWSLRSLQLSETTYRKICIGNNIRGYYLFLAYKSSGTGRYHHFRG